MRSKNLLKSHKITLLYSLHKNYLSNLNLYYWGPRPHFSFSTALMKSSTHTKDDLLQTRLIEFSRIVFLQGSKMEFFQILLRGKVHSSLKQCTVLHDFQVSSFVGTFSWLSGKLQLKSAESTIKLCQLKILQITVIKMNAL